MSPRRLRTFEERLNQDVVKQPDGCWLWTGPLTRKGYGHLTVGGVGPAGTFRQAFAHRAAYELHIGPVPDGLVIDHLCRVRRCVNPAHMEVVTIAENVLRGVGISAENARKTACKRGHPFDAENTKVSASGSRSCRTCGRLAMARYRAAAAASS